MKAKTLAFFLATMFFIMPIIQGPAFDNFTQVDAAIAFADEDGLSEPIPEITAEPTPEPTAEPTPEPTAEPTPEPTAEPTPEPTAEPTPGPTAEPTPGPTVEPTAEPAPEATAGLPNEVSTIDTTQAASVSLSFIKGWVAIAQDTALFDRPGGAKYAVLSQGVGYALARENPGENEDCLLVAFAADESGQTAYISAKNLRPMAPAEIDAYLSQCKKSTKVLRYDGDRARPLLPLVLTPIQEEAPLARASAKLQTLGEQAFTYHNPDGHLKNLVEADLVALGQVEGEYNYSVVTSITLTGTSTAADFAFLCADLRALEEADVSSLAGDSYVDAAFRSASIARVRVSAQIPLSDAMFADCENLETLACGTEAFTLGVIDLSGYTATVYGQSLFYNTPITKVLLPGEIPLSEAMFASCDHLTSIKFISGSLAPAVGADAFRGIAETGTMSFPQDAAGYAQGVFGSPALDNWAFANKGAAVPTSITVSAAKKSLAITASFTLSATVFPDDAANKTVTWKSNNTQIAKVDATGKITAIAFGTATITATTANGLSAPCVVTVGLPSFAFSSQTKAVAVGKSATLVAMVTPLTAQDGAITWKSSDTGIATVSSTGIVKGIKAGTATITATVPVKGGSKMTAKCTVYVTSLTLNATTKATLVGKSFSLAATVKPELAAAGAVTWKSSDPKIATVSNTGVVKGVTAGTVTITATVAYQDGTKATAKCTVYVTAFLVNKVRTTTVGKSFTLAATVTPLTVQSGAITWKSSNTGVATVSSTGAVKGIKVGTATITATLPAKDGSKLTVQCTVYVTSFTLNASTKATLVGKSFTLVPTVTPELAAAGVVTWKSSDTNIATVSSSGVVKGVTTGVATITATVAYQDGTKATAKCAVYVTAFQLNTTARTVSAGKSFALAATVTPLTAQSGTITWKSSDTGIATVSSAGLVKGIKAGTAIITATLPLKDGSATATKCTIYVGAPVTKISITAKKSIYVQGTAQLTPTYLPAEAAFKAVTWSSSNAAVATVSATGLVTGISPGAAVITATAQDGSGKSAICAVTVHANTLSLSESSWAGISAKGASKSITVVTSSASWTAAADQAWISLSRGTGLNNQAVLLTVSANEDEVSRTGSVTFGCAGKTVKLAVTQQAFVPLTAISILGASDLGSGKSGRLQVQAEPANATDASVIWSVDGEEAPATIDQDGTLVTNNVTELTKITVRATATSNPAISATFDIDIHPQPTSLALSCANPYIDLNLAEVSIQLTPEWEPSTALADWEWTSSAANIAVVDQNGLVTGLSPGDATITVTARGLEISASVTMHVIEPEYLYESVTGGLKLTAYLGSAQAIIVPESLAGETVIALAENLFMDNAIVREAYLPSSITVLPNNLFKNCINLQKVTVSNNVTDMLDGVFEGCARFKTMETY